MYRREKKAGRSRSEIRNRFIFFRPQISVAACAAADILLYFLPIFNLSLSLSSSQEVFFLLLVCFTIRFRSKITLSISISMVSNFHSLDFNGELLTFFSPLFLLCCCCSNSTTVRRLNSLRRCSFMCSPVRERKKISIFNRH